MSIRSFRMAPSARLVGTLAHPLNRAEFDEVSGRVRTGYTVLQPRVEISPECGNRSRFARWFTGDTAIDIYSRAVSDVYQDLFGSGIYVGKGAYDVEAFRRSLDGRVPENALASHDLFEGIHGRAALATDIVLYETFPRQYLEFTRRQHRWIRGDWQLLPWLVALGARHRGPVVFAIGLAWIDRWKIVGQPSSQSAAAGARHDAGRRLVDPAGPSRRVDRARCPGSQRPHLHGPGHRLRAGTPTERARRHVPAALRPRRPVAAVAGLPAVRRRGRGRCDRANADSHPCHTAPSAAMDVRRAYRPKSWPPETPDASSGGQMRIAPMLAGVVLVAVVTLRPQALPGALPLLVMWFIAPEVAYVLGHPRADARTTAGRGRSRSCFGESPAARGDTSRSSSVPTISGFLRTISRNSRAVRSPIGHRRPTSA